MPSSSTARSPITYTKRIVRRPAAFATLILLCMSPVWPQESESGKRVYLDDASSVLLLLAKDTTGEFVAQGSGFIITGQKIVTNAHVANAGKVFVELGAARFATHVEKIDVENDLAVLGTDAELTAKPLTLADRQPAPGERIFVISNPRGLEKSISEGVISGLRVMSGRSLLQISAPISHGSSGGPILDAHGEVVGVAVGALESGQNLNFAVPATSLRRLLASRGVSANKTVAATLSQLAQLEDTQASAQYSSDPNSDWQKAEVEIKALLSEARNEAGEDVTDLLKVSDAALKDGETDIAIDAAQRAADHRASPAAELALSKSINAKAIWESAGKTKTDLLDRAEQAARLAVNGSHPPSAEMYYALADVLENKQSYTEALAKFGAALTATQTAKDDVLAASSIRGLVRCNSNLKRWVEAEKWFDELVSRQVATAWDWSTWAEFLGSAGKYKDAGDSYAKAASLGGGYVYWCESANTYSLASEPDLELSSARSCIQDGMGVSGSEVRLAVAHVEIAEVLDDRGVYSEALSHAKEATVLDSKNAFAYAAMATALKKLHRPQEAIVAAQQAVRLSDGKYGSMHFTLGSAYFDVEDWTSARDSFQRAAEMDTTDPAAAYNVALCYQRQNYFRDAIRWFQEYLRRKPDADDKADVLDRIRNLQVLVH